VSRAVLAMLNVNLGYKKGETIGVLFQEWAHHLGDKKPFVASMNVSKLIYEVLRKNNFAVELFSYTPSEARNGVDAPKALYDKINKDILIMPTVFSLTHTDFRKYQSAKGTRIASMPGFTEEMFETLGSKNDSAIFVYEKMKSARYVKITGKNTEIIVRVNPDKINLCSGMMDKRGAFDNLPGSEVSTAPLDAQGYFTVPKGFGGEVPLLFDVTFYLKNGRFIGIKGASDEAQVYIDRNVRPIVFGGKNFEVLAELGIGTNTNITVEYIKKHGWSVLLAEKIFGSAHFANGNNSGMGGVNNAPVHVDWVVPGVKIEYLR